MIKAPKGTMDILPNMVYKWHYIERILRDISQKYAYKEIRTPTFEYTELFARGVGDTTDVVSKEMYTFADKGGRSITLRPEGTAGVGRSFIESGMAAGAQPTKLFYIIPCYRYEKPQSGRFREFRQYGVEMFGASSPGADAEVIALAFKIIDTLQIKGISLRVNNIGCKTCRREYNTILREYMESRLEKLCHTCRDRLDKNPMRILDCKSELCQSVTAEAPRIFDYTCKDCKEHFDGVLLYLNAMEIPYTIDKGIVRGLDYYTKTVFELVSEEIGAQGSVCGGGRYDDLVEELGGKPCPGIGFAMGMERLLLAMENTGAVIPKESLPDIFIVSMDKESDVFAAGLIQDLRGNGLICEKDHLGRSLKAQMKYANKIGARYVVVIGADELQKGVVALKDMETGEEKIITFDELRKFGG